MYGAPGSRVIVTTRNEAIARMMKTIQSHNLNCISNEDCWSLFLDHAFASRSVADADTKLEVIREKVINNCHGLPLAARTLGGLLRSKQRKDWEKVMNGKIWNLQGDTNNIISVLSLSYYHLPSHLKRCFAYCAILPKDYVFQKKQLVLLWMAEGLIEQGDDLEDMGEEYFEDLFSRSLFLSSSNDGFVMHDLVNDLAQVVAGDTCFRLEDKLTARKHEKARHSSYISGFFDRSEKFELFEKIKYMRTFLPLSLQSSKFYLAKCVPSYLSSKLPYLRVLSFKHYNITDLPDSIGDLKHLRFLDLSFTEIITLPETTTSLCNLQTILLKGCRDLKKLPSEMQNLINLRHLDMQNTYRVEGMPQGIEELKSLRTLSDFVVGKGNEVGTTALMNLKFLQRALRISRLQNVANASNVRGAILLHKEKIDDLVMEQGDRGELEKMKPHGNLKNLTIKNYDGIQFPSWVGDPLFSNLVRLELAYCSKCTTLPQLGLLSSLKDLAIIRFSNVKAVDREFYGESTSNSKPFPALERLQFRCMHEWVNWNICGHKFPHLRELFIVKCPKLLGNLPSHLPSLQKLEIEECLELVVSFQSLPVISHLDIKKCRKVELGGGFSSATESLLFSPEELTVGCSSGLSSFSKVGKNWEFSEDNAEKFLQKGIADNEFKIVKFYHCVRLEKLLPWLHSFKSLRKLFIYHCSRLVCLPDAVIYSSSCLEELTIQNCDSLISIGRHQLPPTLKRLEIIYCFKLQKLLNVGGACSSSRVTDEESISCDSTSFNLQYLKIDNCESLTFLGELPASLKDLVIDSSSYGNRVSAKLESIAEWFDNNTSLESIEIGYLPYLKSLPKNLQMLTNLHHVRIHHCPSFVSFPRGGLPIVHLRNLMVTDCKKFEALPNNMQNLTSLEYLTIRKCPSVVSFPQGGLPTTHFKALTVEYCEKLQTLPDNIHNLTSLQELTIKNCSSVVSFPHGGLPTSHLKKLTVEDCEKLEALPNNIHNLTSLLELTLKNCPGILTIAGIIDSFVCQEKSRNQQAQRYFQSTFVTIQNFVS
ncbi:putative disease resistance protein At3g14460 [Hevea brasiliensis]|uniref:putative disease resistance protein At3g14460 n=1 Tax=Hevea brasiliensis TaxID=3981 RepID=UPI0026009989|nr:putative disease resistance protein At3g14460 [Hevea brasiliensis]